MGGKSTAVDRRTLKYNNLDDLARDIRMMAGQGIKTSGNWTAAQNIEHVTLLIDASIDGFKFNVPLPLRVLGRLIRGRVLNKGIPAGKIKIPPVAKASFDPDPATQLEDAVQHLSDSVERAKQKKMTHASPIFGKLTHEQWVQLHCRHAEMHFSFLLPATESHEANSAHNAARHAPTTA